MGIEPNEKLQGLSMKDNQTKTNWDTKAPYTAKKAPWTKTKAPRTKTKGPWQDSNGDIIVRVEVVIPK